MQAPDFLTQAVEVMTERGKQRDGSENERSMSACVEAFNAIEGTQLTERQGWVFMQVLKLTRAAATARNGRYNADDFVDGAAYAGLAGEAAAAEFAHDEFARSLKSTATVMDAGSPFIAFDSWAKEQPADAPCSCLPAGTRIYPADGLLKPACMGAKELWEKARADFNSAKLELAQSQVKRLSGETETPADETVAAPWYPDSRYWIEVAPDETECPIFTLGSVLFKHERDAEQYLHIFDDLDRYVWDFYEGHKYRIVAYTTDLPIE